MNYKIAKIELEGYPIQCVDEEVENLTHVFLDNQPNVSRLERMAMGVGLNCDFGIQTSDGYSWFAIIFGTIPGHRISLDDVDIMILFPWKEEDQRAVNIYTSSELPNKIIRTIVEVFSSYLTRR